jgi:2-polyprenyl-3-methyl-5-hydroxy-6-metoxy-1,4-benzoquinol methylase
MNRPGNSSQAEASVLLRLHQTRDAFDSVAAVYDGDRGNNAAIQDMREEMWQWLDASFAPGAHLLDLGCGTGLDAARMARVGYRVTASDWSAEMVRRTSERAERERLSQQVQTINIGAHELERVAGSGAFDGIYSNLGALNCVPDLNDVAQHCARLLKAGGKLVFSVIGRVCPWEVAHYARRGRFARAAVRYVRGATPVRLNERTVWTRYYTPREFYRPFGQLFGLAHYRGLCVFVPPPYLTGIRERHPQWQRRLWRIDRQVSGWPLLRGIGDHFLIVMHKR